MSVNDPLPFLAELETLLRTAVARGVPVLGHCLGGQMLAKVLGAAVSDLPHPEIGWTPLVVEDNVEARSLARAWLGDAPELPVFEWHFQTFDLPDGATLLASSSTCRHQAFAYGPHLGMQFHIEVDAEKLGRWTAEAPVAGDPLLEHAGVQSMDAMAADTARWLPESHKTAAHIYRHWLSLT
jgi:GMP synthase-like glutamine amidotransferase